MSDPMRIRALAPWFGGCRELASQIGPELGRLAWCGVLFAGGLSELPHIQTRSGLASDLHRHLINLARVVAHPPSLLRMIRMVDRLLYHESVLADAQRRCLARELEHAGGLFGSGSEAESLEPSIEWAADYFVAGWMGRGGSAGRPSEFSQALSVRYAAGGGCSARRWRSAVESLPAWGKALERWQFVREDAFGILERLKPQAAAGLYLDPPWVGAGEEYSHAFKRPDHVRLAKALERLPGYRIVLRYGDHPLIRELYPEPAWRWREQSSKSQTGGEISEVLIVRGDRE